MTFSVQSGGGSVTGGDATTDSSGIAAVGSWMLGTIAGANALSATCACCSGSPVSFSASGTPGPLASFAVSLAGSQTNGQAFSSPERFATPFTKSLG